MITTTERQERIIDQYAELINPSKARLLRNAGLGIVESRREGAYVWDQSGTRYIDCRDETDMYSLGRRNPRLINALKSALGEFDIGNSLAISEPRVNLARKLGAISPEGALKGVVFGVSETEILDFAVQIATTLTRRNKVIAMEGFAGCSVADVCHLPYGDLNALETAIDHDTACIIVEPVQALSGVDVASDKYMTSLRKICDRTGALMIVDENRTGLGRTGRLFGIEHYGIVPDIMTLGKGLSGGIFPISAAVLRSKYLSYWNEHASSRISTFAGSDLGCIVALETLACIEEKRIPQKVSELEERFEAGFERLLDKYSDVVKSFRHKGLLMSVEFFHDQTGPQMSRDLSQFGVLASHLPDAPSIMPLLPSLIIEDHDVDTILYAFDCALAGAQWVTPAKPFDFAHEHYL